MIYGNLKKSSLGPAVSKSLASFCKSFLLLFCIIFSGQKVSATNIPVDWKSIKPPIGNLIPCINGGHDAARIKKQAGVSSDIVEKAEFALNSSVALVGRRVKNGNLPAPGAELMDYIASSSYLGCGILLTAAHNIMVNVDPRGKENLIALNSNSVFDDWENPDKIGQTIDLRIHPDYEKKFKEELIKLGNTEKAHQALAKRGEPNGYDLALILVDEKKFSGKIPIKVASEEWLQDWPQELSFTSYPTITVSGFGAEEIDGEPLGYLKIADLVLHSSAVSKALDGSAPVELKRSTGNIDSGDSGGGAFMSRKSPSGNQYGLVAVNTAVNKNLAYVALIAGKNRDFLRQAFSELTKGKKCRNPF